jgi:hypothetical protein
MLFMCSLSYLLLFMFCVGMQVAAGGCAGQQCSMEAALARQQQQQRRKYSQAEEDAVHE